MRPNGKHILIRKPDGFVLDIQSTMTIRINHNDAKILDDDCERTNQNHANGIREAIRNLKDKK